MDSSGQFVVKFYRCAACGEVIGGFALQSHPVSVQILRREGDIRIDPVTAQIQELQLYCAKCGTPGLAQYQAQCQVCHKDTSLYTTTYMYLELEEGVVVARVNERFLLVNNDLSWCSQECLDKQRGEVEIEVLQVPCAS